jgi:hypothetical protein
MLHPKRICADFKSMGATLVLDGEDLFIENHEKITPELEELAKSYKSRIITYLKGGYSDFDHNIKQTIDKIINFYFCIEQEMNGKIGSWLNQDEKSVNMLMDLFVKFSDNGWFPMDPVANYENEETNKLSKEIYKRAMSYFKGA